MADREMEESELVDMVRPFGPRGEPAVTTRKPRVYEQGASTYVIGTDDIGTALAALGISPETHRWGSTEFGSWVRRQGMWRRASDLRTPKDAKPGVCFVGRIRSKEETP